MWNLDTLFRRGTCKLGNVPETTKTIILDKQNAESNVRNIRIKTKLTTKENSTCQEKNESILIALTVHLVAANYVIIITVP